MLLLFHVLAIPVPGGPATKENKYVRVEIRLEDTTVAPGADGAILFGFTPAEGIHVNTDPPVEIEIEKNRAVTLHGDPDLTVDKETGFLSTSSPVRQQFSVSPAASPGEYSIQGTIVYYFCSDTQGWCTKFKQPVTLKLIVPKR